MVVQKSFGQIQLPNDPGGVLQAGTKQYIDAGDAANTPTTRQIIAGTGLTGGGTLAADRTLAVAYGSTSTTACVGNDSRLSGNAPTASPTFTGTASFTGTATFVKMVQIPVALTDGTTVAVDASLGNTFRLTLTATGHTMGNPSNSTDGQMILFEITSGGAFTFSWGTNYVWGSDVVVPTLSQTSGKVDYVGFIYNSTAAKWRGLAVARGY